MTANAVIKTIFATILGIAMMLGTVISPVSAESIHQIPELDLARHELTSAVVKPSIIARPDQTHQTQLTSAIQITPNLLAQPVSSQGTCQAIPSKTGCQITYNGCNNGSIAVVSPPPACNCTCQ